LQTAFKVIHILSVHVLGKQIAAAAQTKTVTTAKVRMDAASSTSAHTSMVSAAWNNNNGRGSLRVRSELNGRKIVIKPASWRKVFDHASEWHSVAY
jgi:hypothetical protein